MITPTRQYGYFAIERVHGGIVTLPDGEKRYFESFEKAEEARNEWIAENLLPAATKKAVEDREAFTEGCSVQEERVKQQGLLSPDLVVKKVIDAKGGYVGNPSTKNFQEIVEEAALEKFPEPTAYGLAYSAAGAVEKIVVWAASLYLHGERKRLPAFPTWTFGLPIESVLGVLNELATEGWSVAQVSEDRGLYTGTTNRTDSAVTTARYLLTRDA